MHIFSQFQHKIQGAEREELWAEMSFTLQFWNQNSELNGHGERIEPQEPKPKKRLEWNVITAFISIMVARYYLAPMEQNLKNAFCSDFYV